MKWKETIQLVLEEYAQEQANNTKAVNDLVTAVNTVTGKFTEFEQKLEKPKQTKRFNRYPAYPGD